MGRPCVSDPARVRHGPPQEARCSDSQAPLCNLGVCVCSLESFSCPAVLGRTFTGRSSSSSREHAVDVETHSMNLGNLGTVLCMVKGWTGRAVMSHGVGDSRQRYGSMREAEEGDYNTV